MTDKRALSPDADEGALILKKQKTNGDIVEARATKDGVRRTSSLHAPIMLLTGHEGELYTVKFSPDGTTLASAGYDKNIFLWRTYDECENYMALEGHKNAILEVQWNPEGDRVYSASADRTVRVWDAESGKQIRWIKGHDTYVNSCCPARSGPPLLVSGSDDGTSKLWDLRQWECVSTFTERFQVLSVAMADQGDQIFSAGIENEIKVWDLRKEELSMTLQVCEWPHPKHSCSTPQQQGHSDTVTGIAVSPDGNHLLSNGMDNTLRMWDVRPYAPANRCVKVFTGATHNYERNLLRCAWSAEGDRVTAGSADWNVHVWEVASRRLLYKLPGHKGSVNECVFHPKEPIIASASSDKRLYLGELNL